MRQVTSAGAAASARVDADRGREFVAFGRASGALPGRPIAWAAPRPMIPGCALAVAGAATATMVARTAVRFVVLTSRWASGLS